MLTLKRISSEIFSDLTRAVRLLKIVVPASVAVVGAIAFANRTATGDEITATAVVPLIFSYLMVRAIMWLASGIPEATEEEKLAFERHRRQHPPQFSIEISGILAVAFVLGMWWIVAGGLSAGAYWALGLTRAFSATALSLKWTCLIVASVAVSICLMTLCKSWLLRIAKFFHDTFDDPLSFFHGSA